MNTDRAQSEKQLAIDPAHTEDTVITASPGAENLQTTRLAVSNDPAVPTVTAGADEQEHPDAGPVPPQPEGESEDDEDDDDLDGDEDDDLDDDDLDEDEDDDLDEDEDDAEEDDDDLDEDDDEGDEEEELEDEDDEPIDTEAVDRYIAGIQLDSPTRVAVLDEDEDEDDGDSDDEDGEDELEDLNAEEKLILCAQAADAVKAEDIVALDVRQLTIIADYFLICTGKSSIQIRAIADRIEDKLRDRGIRKLRIEGYQEATWILMDYSDVLIHVMAAEQREFYRLEDLWADAKGVYLGLLPT